MAFKIYSVFLLLALFGFYSCGSVTIVPNDYVIYVGQDKHRVLALIESVNIYFNATEEANTLEFPRGDYTTKYCSFRKVDKFPQDVNCTLTDTVLQIILPYTMKIGIEYVVSCTQAIYNLDQEKAFHFYYDKEANFLYTVQAYKDRSPHELYISLDDLTLRTPLHLQFHLWEGAQEFCPAKNHTPTSGYEPTPPLPTFLFIYLTGDTVQLRNMTGRQNNFTLNARPAIALLDQSFYVEILTIEIIMEQILYEYLNFPFLFPFIDTVILPGLIPEVLDTLGLMFIPEESITEFYKESELKMLISQKMSAQYFGAVLVPANKTNFWMSYGLQNFMQYRNFEDDRTLAIERMRYYSCVSAMQEDGWSFTHSMIDTRDDVITREKAGCLFLLLRDYLGESNFQKVLRQYIFQYNYTAVTVQNFKDVIRQVVHFNDTDRSGDLIDTFTQNSGYPVVNVIKYIDSFNVSQSRFSYENRGDTSQIWLLPINYGNSDSSVMFEDWLNAPEKVIIDDKNVRPVDILIVNYGWKGFYRVNYDRNSWNFLIAKLWRSTFKDIPVENRAQLIDDSMNLARAGYIDYDIPLQVVDYLNKEMEFLPWAVAHDNFKYLYRMMEGPHKDDIDNLLLLKKFIRYKVEHIFTDNPPWLRELSHMDLVLELSCLSNGVYCETKSKEVFKNGSATDINPFYGNALGCRLAHKLDNMEWAYEFLNQTNKTDLERRRFFLRILPCSLDPRSLLYSITDTFLNVSKTLAPIEQLNVLSHTVHFSTFWNLAKVLKHAAQIIEEMHDDFVFHRSNVKGFIKDVVRRIYTEDMGDWYKNLLNVTEQYGIMTGTETGPLRKIVERQVQWRKDYVPRIVAYLKHVTQMTEKKKELKREYCQKQEEALMMDEIDVIDTLCRYLI